MYEHKREQLARQVAEVMVDKVRAIGYKACEYKCLKQSHLFDPAKQGQSSLAVWLAEKSSKVSADSLISDYTLCAKVKASALVPHCDWLIQQLVQEVASAYRVGFNYYSKISSDYLDPELAYITDSLSYAERVLYDRLTKPAASDYVSLRQLIKALQPVAKVWLFKAGSCDRQAAKVLGYDVLELHKIDRAYYCVFNRTVTVDQLKLYLAVAD